MRIPSLTRKKGMAEGFENCSHEDLSNLIWGVSQNFGESVRFVEQRLEFSQAKTGQGSH